MNTPNIYEYSNTDGRSAKIEKKGEIWFVLTLYNGQEIRTNPFMTEQLARIFATEFTGVNS